MRGHELGGFFDDLIDQISGAGAQAPTYPGVPLAPGLSLADVKPGGRLFPYAAIGGALLVAALAVYLVRR